MSQSSQRRGRHFQPVLDTLPDRIAPTVYLPPPPDDITPPFDPPPPNIWVDAGLQPVEPNPTPPAPVGGELVG